MYIKYEVFHMLWSSTKLVKLFSKDIQLEEKIWHKISTTSLKTRLLRVSKMRKIQEQMVLVKKRQDQLQLLMISKIKWQKWANSLRQANHYKKIAKRLPQEWWETSVYSHLKLRTTLILLLGHPNTQITEFWLGQRIKLMGVKKKSELKWELLRIRKDGISNWTSKFIVRDLSTEKYF